MIKKQVTSKIISEFRNLQKKEVQYSSNIAAIDVLRSLESEIKALLDNGWSRESVIAEIKDKLDISITHRTFNAYWAQIQRESKANKDSDNLISSLKNEVKSLSEEVDRLNLQLNLAFKKLSQKERSEIEDGSSVDSSSTTSVDSRKSIKPKNHDVELLTKEESSASDKRKSVTCNDKDL